MQHIIRYSLNSDNALDGVGVAADGLTGFVCAADRSAGSVSAADGSAGLIIAVDRLVYVFHAANDCPALMKLPTD